MNARKEEIPDGEPENRSRQEEYPERENGWEREEPEEPASSLYYPEQPDRMAQDSDEPDEGNDFDILSLLDEQLEEYSNMSLSDRMEEIEVDLMEISLDDLSAFVKENRRRR